MLTNDDKIALLEAHRTNRAAVVCLEHKVDTLAKQISALARSLETGAPVTPAEDGTILTSAGVVSGETISSLAEAVIELEQARLAFAISQERVDKSGLL